MAQLSTVFFGDLPSHDDSATIHDLYVETRGFPVVFSSLQEGSHPHETVLGFLYGFPASI